MSSAHSMRAIRYRIAWITGICSTRHRNQVKLFLKINMITDHRNNNGKIYQRTIYYNLSLVILIMLRLYNCITLIHYTYHIFIIIPLIFCKSVHWLQQLKIFNKISKWVRIKVLVIFPHP